MGLGGGAPGKFCIIRPLRTHLRLSEIAKQIEIKALTWGLTWEMHIINLSLIRNKSRSKCAKRVTTTEYYIPPILETKLHYSWALTENIVGPDRKYIK